MPIEYRVIKKLEIAGSHHLDLPYESKCQHIHGHNWNVEIECKTNVLTKYGMVVDFTDIKKLIHDPLDHKNFNTIFDFNPTAENIAEWIYKKLNDYIYHNKSYHESTRCIRVKVQESEGNIAIYESC